MRNSDNILWMEYLIDRIDLNEYWIKTETKLCYISWSSLNNNSNNNNNEYSEIYIVW